MGQVMQISKSKVEQITQVIRDATEVSEESYTLESLLERARHVEHIVAGVRKGIAAYRAVEDQYVSKIAFRILDED